MSKAQQLQRVLDAGIVAVVRAPGPEGLVEVIRASWTAAITIEYSQALVEEK